jgi:hypothetical protein
MVDLEQLSSAALRGDALVLRDMVQELLRDPAAIKTFMQPPTSDPRVLAMSAGLVELLAGRTNQPPPSWTAGIGPVGEPVFLVKSAQTMRHLRKLCETESPEPLRKRNLLAPPGYLGMA